jgi:hypothetical protein
LGVSKRHNSSKAERASIPQHNRESGHRAASFVVLSKTSTTNEERNSAGQAAGRDAGPILIFDITIGGCRGPLLRFASGIRASEYEADAQKAQLPAQLAIMTHPRGLALSFAK